MSRWFGRPGDPSRGAGHERQEIQGDSIADGAAISFEGPTRHSTAVPGILLLATGVAAAAMSLRLGLTVRGVPGPGLWPLLASVLIVVTAVGVVLRPRHRLCEQLTRSEVTQTAPAIAIMVAFVALLPTAGVVTACTLTGVAWLRLVAHERWILSLALPPAVGLAIYLTFVVMLQVPLPVDPFLPR